MTPEGAVLSCTAVVGAIVMAALICYAYFNPCVRTEPGYCGGGLLIVGKVPVRQPRHPCEICVERRHRE